AIFCGADFWQDKAQNAVNPIGFTSILTKCWRKSARKKRGSDYARHPSHICFLFLKLKKNSRISPTVILVYQLIFP
ncbi:MAG: hypothetical protein IJO73_01100, partial [Clostridia bacterium]|nr:hypothetical protein [Clostridia bacterium]